MFESILEWLHNLLHSILNLNNTSDGGNETKIAYKILSSSFEDKILDNTGNIKTNLLALLFKFNSADSTYLEVHSLCFNYNTTQTGTSNQHEPPGPNGDNNPFVTTHEFNLPDVDENGLAYPIGESTDPAIYGDDGTEEPGKIPSKIDTSNPRGGDHEKDYQNLDYYPDSGRIGLVFFTVQEILTLTTFHENLIISGCELNLGKRLSRSENDQGNIFRDAYFTLKIEGETVKPLYLSTGDIRGNESLVEEELEGPGYITGPSCPPIWKAYASSIPGIVEILEEGSPGSPNPDFLASTNKINDIIRKFYKDFAQALNSI